MEGYMTWLDERLPKVLAKTLTKGRNEKVTNAGVIDFMVGTRGFEPPTPASRTRCSTRLSHVPTPGKDSLFYLSAQV